MIIKFFEREKISKTGLDFYLIYGDNEGQKKEIIESILKHFNGLTKKYDEKEFLENKMKFYLVFWTIFFEIIKHL